MGFKQYLILVVVCLIMGFAASSPLPDSELVPTPGPGLAYGGIPYGSVSGRVLDYKPPPGGRALNLANPNYAPIEPWLR